MRNQGNRQANGLVWSNPLLCGIEDMEIDHNTQIMKLFSV